MLQDLVIGRLKEVLGDTADILPGVDLANLGKFALRFPSVFVVDVSETGSSPQFMTSAFGQQRSMGIGIVFVVKNVSDSSGKAASDDLLPLRTKIDDALFGWTPNDLFDPLFLTRGALMQVQEGILWWKSEYSTSFLKRNY